MRSSPRRALARAASSMRARSTPSSNSLMLPFMPSSSRSFGGVIDAVQVDHASLNQAAQLKQMVPVASIAREPGRVEAQHSADFSATKPRNQPFEARPCHQAAGGTAEVLVDHFDLAEATLPRDIDELV